MLAIRGLRKSYTRHLMGLSSEVLRGVDLDLRPGECVALTGPSGSGKSTLLRCVYGQALADAGSIVVGSDGDAREVVGAAPRDVLDLRRAVMGIATQFLDVVPRVPALTLVAQAGLGPDAGRLLLAELGLPEELHEVPPATFSGGQRQIVNLALALARPRPLLLLDEVTASLDRGRRSAALRVLEERKRQDVAMLAVFHDVPSDGVLVDRVVRMRDGRVEAA
jgi:alpha-D-ribose 1-methylphosphonate 5-triphosphate synthase subunit PhnL